LQIKKGHEKAHLTIKGKAKRDALFPKRQCNHYD